MRPEVLQITLEKMRRRVERDPQVLLETWGAPMSSVGEYIYADVFGIEDELIDDMIELSSVSDTLRKPIPSKISLAEPTLEPAIRVANYRLRSGWCRSNIDAFYLPGWRHDDQFHVRLLYVRYKREISRP
jgi:hypothetical protein